MENSLLYRLFSFLNLPKKFELERNIFLGVNSIALISVILISIYDLINKDYQAVLFAVCLAFPVYATCIAVTIWNSNLKKVIIIQMFVAFAMVTFSFFSLNGFNGPFALDLMNLFMITAIIARRKIRPIYLVFVCGFALGLIYIELFQTHWIHNIRPNDPPIIQILFLLMRIIMTINMAVTIKSEFEKEQVLLSRSLNEVQRKNNQMTNLYEEVRAQKDSLEELNSQLERLVNIRTEQIVKKNQQLLDYAFYNSHKVRGPLARVIGLVYLLRLQPNMDDKSAELVERLGNSTYELDEMIKQISKLLEEKKEQLSEHD